MMILRQTLRFGGRRQLSAAAKESIVVTSSLNGVRTVRMNNPKRLNGWTQPMMKTMQAEFKAAAADPDVHVLVVTATDPYYCAGVDLSGSIRPMMPGKLFDMIVRDNQRLFDSYLNFPKPLLIAINGPAIGASVTSSTLSDAIIASEKATFSTPFARLGVTPEGCSSMWFEEVMGAANAERMLGAEGWQPSAAEARDAGFVEAVVPHEDLLGAAQDMAEKWISEGRKRTVLGRTDPGLIEKLKDVNARESLQLATAFMDVPFLKGQEDFLTSKGKAGPARMFTALRVLRPLWRPMAPVGEKP